MLRIVPVIAVLIASIWPGSTVIEAPQGPGPNAPPAERLFVARFEPGLVEERYQKEYERLSGLCKNSQFDCMTQHFVPVRLKAATVRQAPDPSSPVVGSIVVVLKLLKYEQSATIIAGFDFETASTSSRPVVWIDDISDWGYGVHVSGMRPRDEWLQLVGPPFPASAWIPMAGDQFSVSAEPLDDDILNLEPMQATGPDGTPRTIPRGSYKVLSSKAGTVEFRAEVPSDMDCGENVQPPRVMPPTLRAPASEFFRPDGKPRFARKYTRGC